MGDLTRASQMLHSFTFPLGDRNWLTAQYWLLGLEEGYRWVFSPTLYSAVPEDTFWPWRIGKGLGRTARFGGLTDRPYSVALHSVNLARYIGHTGGSKAAQLLALLHDAPECLGVGDMNAHLKGIVGRQAKAYENDLTDWLLERLSIYPTDDDRRKVHAADKLFGAAEARLLNMDNGSGWSVETDHPVAQFLQTKCTLLDERCSPSPASVWIDEWDALYGKH